MNKRLIAFLKKYFPTFFAFVASSPFLAYCATEMDRLRYIYCILAKKPYFGTISCSGQTWTERRPFMESLIKKELKKNSQEEFNVLEIGSWTGDSSIIWANAIKESQKKGSVTCIDPWKPYVKKLKDEKTNAAIILMDRALRKNKVFKLFMHNVHCSHNSDIITPLKGLSAEILPSLQGNLYDLIFIDGDHSYSGVKYDLENIKSLLVEEGVVCGDDLDLQLKDIDEEVAHANKETNNILDPLAGKTYHPGVTLAVAEFFKKEVSSYNGFWAMRKSSNQWLPVQL